MPTPHLYVTIRPTTPPGPPVYLNLLGDGNYGRSGLGGWQITDRPRRAASVEWLDYSPFEMTLPLLLGGTVPQRSVEAACGQVEAWEKPAPGSITPPVLSILGPVPHTDLRWVVKALAFTEALRDQQAGFRIQQTLTITLLEYVPAILALTNASPAKAAQGRQGTAVAGSARRYTVRSGDTLSAIAAKLLGDYRRDADIARLNNIRDPARIQVGQVLAIPAH